MADIPPTIPLPPYIIIFLFLKFVLNLSRSVFSVQATIAAAVVNDPAGSGKTDISKGGTIDFFAVSIISRAKDASFPQINTPVFFAFLQILKRLHLALELSHQ